MQELILRLHTRKEIAFRLMDVSGDLAIRFSMIYVISLSDDIPRDTHVKM